MSQDNPEKQKQKSVSQERETLDSLLQRADQGASSSARDLSSACEVLKCSRYISGGEWKTRALTSAVM